MRSLPNSLGPPTCLHIYICHIHNIIHVCILMAQRHVFYLWVRPKKNDSVNGYDESSPRIFMARPTPSRAASCSPCVHQYKTDNVELMQRHVVQIFLGVKLLVFLTQIICLFFVHIMQYDINWAWHLGTTWTAFHIFALQRVDIFYVIKMCCLQSALWRVFYWPELMRVFINAQWCELVCHEHSALQCCK